MKINTNSILFLFAAVLFTISVGYHSQLGRFADDNQDGQFLVHYNVKNTGSRDLKGSVNVWIPELDIYSSGNAFTAKKSNTYSGFVFPLDYSGVDADAGLYLARVKYSSDNAKSSRWAWVRIE
ncbi:MAG TPA: hypothetical protein VJI75_02450 [Candidatus Nanoarchaeia archaeon]|nr:hypothetical protein [Candidatus Nanoarchaeia archaeon]